MAKGNRSRSSGSLRISMQFFGSRRTGISLPKKEYGKVIHEINTIYHTRYSGDSSFVHYSGNTAYVVNSKGFDDYIITAKYKINSRRKRK